MLFTHHPMNFGPSCGVSKWPKHLHSSLFVLTPSNCFTLLLPWPSHDGSFPQAVVPNKLLLSVILSQ